jgi:predicted trehalose synthase
MFTLVSIVAISAAFWCWVLTKQLTQTHDRLEQLNVAAKRETDALQEKIEALTETVERHAQEAESTSVGLRLLCKDVYK